MEIARPALRVIGLDTEGAGLELAISYHYQDKRAWRVGYRYFRSGSDYSWVSFRQAMATKYYGHSKDAIHQLSMGHQWEFTDGRLRPFLGADALIGHNSWVSFSMRSEDVHLDTIAAGGWPNSIQFTTGRDRTAFITLGLGLAGGMRYALHSNLSLEWRLIAAYTRAFGIGFEIPGPVQELFVPVIGFPEVGTGIYLTFQF